MQIILAKIVLNKIIHNLQISSFWSIKLQVDFFW